MICPYCQNLDTRVLDTRVQKLGNVKRRRQCVECNEKFTTIEMMLTKGPVVIKKDLRREPFNKSKIKKGVQAACQKRPVTLNQIEQIVDDVTKSLKANSLKEISSHNIGKCVMKELKKVDHVAFVRFASIYRTFDDITEFVKSLEEETHANLY